MSNEHEAFLGIGANLSMEGYASPKETCLAALEKLAAAGDITCIATSPWYRTEPQPISDQPWFFNAVVQIKTHLTPPALLARLHSIERAMGRVRQHRNEARIIDMDIIDFAGVVRQDAPILPHPRMHERGFVLYPLRDLKADWVHPISGAGIDTLIAKLPPQNMELAP